MVVTHAIILIRLIVRNSFMPIINNLYVRHIGEFNNKSKKYSNTDKKNNAILRRCAKYPGNTQRRKDAVALLSLLFLLTCVSQVRADCRVYPGNSPSRRNEMSRGYGERSFQHNLHCGNYPYPAYGVKDNRAKKGVDATNRIKNFSLNDYSVRKWNISETVDSLKQHYNEYFPDVKRIAKLKMQQAIFAETGQCYDPDAIFFHHFDSAENDATSVTGWRHDKTRPVESRTVTECLLSNFPADARDNMDVVDQMTGIYCVSADVTTSFGGENQVPIKPSLIAKIVIELDFYNLYKKQLTAYWQTKTQDMVNLFIMMQGLANMSANDEMQTFYLTAFGIIANHQGDVNKYVFDINGYLSTDMLVLTKRDAESIDLYMPRSTPKFIRFNHLAAMKTWIVEACGDERRREDIANYFSIEDRQDGFFYDGVDSWLRRLVEAKSHPELMEKIWREQQETSDEVFEFLSARQQARAYADADSLIKSNAEVRLDMAIRYFSVVDMFLPNPLTPVINLGLGIDKMVEGDTENDRRAGAAVAFSEGVNLLQMAFCSVIESRLSPAREQQIVLPSGASSHLSLTDGMQSAYLSLRNDQNIVRARTISFKKLSKKPSLHRENQPGGGVLLNAAELNRLNRMGVSQSFVDIGRLSYADWRGILYDSNGESYIALERKVYRLTPTSDNNIFFLGQQREQGIIYLTKVQRWKVINYQQEKIEFTMSCRTSRSLGPLAQHYCLRLSSRLSKILDEHIASGLHFNDVESMPTLHIKSNLFVSTNKLVKYIRYRNKFFIAEARGQGYVIYGYTSESGKYKIVHTVLNGEKPVHHLTTRIEHLWEFFRLARLSLRPIKMNFKDELNSLELKALEEYQRQMPNALNLYMSLGMPADFGSPVMRKLWMEMINGIRTALTKLKPVSCTTRKIGIISEQDRRSLRLNDILETPGFILTSINKNAAYQIEPMVDIGHVGIEFEFHLVKKGYPINSRANQWSDSRVMIPENSFFKVVRVEDHSVVLAEIESILVELANYPVKKMNFGIPDIAAFRLEREKNRMVSLLKNDVATKPLSSPEMNHYTEILAALARRQVQSAVVEDFSEAGSDFINDWLRFGIDGVNEASVRASAEARRMLRDYQGLEDYNQPVYRSVYCPPGVYGDLVKEGDIVMDKGFMSASALPVNSIAWRESWSKHRAGSPADEAVMLIVDSNAPKKVASTHLLIDHIIIPPDTRLIVQSITPILDFAGRQVTIVCLSLGEKKGVVKDLYSGAASG